MQLADEGVEWSPAIRVGSGHFLGLAVLPLQELPREAGLSNIDLLQLVVQLNDKVLQRVWLGLLGLIQSEVVVEKIWQRASPHPHPWELIFEVQKA